MAEIVSDFIRSSTLQAMANKISAALESGREKAYTETIPYSKRRKLKYNWLIKNAGALSKKYE